MKRIVISAVLSCLLLATSCGKDFLTVNPTTNLTESDYYDSEERIFNALIAAYDPLQWPAYSFGQFNALTLVSDVMSDDINVGGGSATDNPHLHDMSNFNATGESVCWALWTVFYSGINRSNIVLEKIEGVPAINANVKAQYIAEARVLRAYYYSWLWKLWGNIPYYNINPTTEPYLVEQLTADNVYIKIIEDLEAAITSNQLIVNADVTEKGRVTLGMAQMLKAEVVMYQNDDSRYASVLTDMKSIINSDEYDLHADFAEIWEDEGEWCDESIWEINYSDKNSSRAWENPLAVGGTVYPKLIGINSLKESAEYDGGWGFAPVREEFYNIYQSSDQRRDGGILNFDAYKTANPDVTYEGRYQDTGYFLLKYLARAGGNSENTGDKDLNFRNNYRVYRYAEALLNGAELAARTGDNTTAQSYLNMVRARAFNTTPDALGTKEVTATVDNILAERRLELYGEGKRFWDLVRSGKAVSVLGARGYTDSKKHLPIPSSEIDKAEGTLIQNPY